MPVKVDYFFKDLKKYLEIEITFLVKSKSDFIQANELITTFNLTNFIFKPYYNDNLSFFEENVFLNKEDMLRGKRKIEEIYKNKIVNSTNFGKLIISNKGEVFVNMNENKIGELSNFDITTILKNTLTPENNWLETRINKSPCNKCLFQLLCPPISNYEKVINKYNLCNIQIL